MTATPHHANQDNLTLEALDFPIRPTTSLRELVTADLSVLGEVESILGTIVETENHGVFIDDAVALVRTEGIRVPLEITISWDAENKAPVYANSKGEVLTSLRDRYDIQSAQSLHDSFQMARRQWRQHPAIKAARGQTHASTEQALSPSIVSGSPGAFVFMSALATVASGVLMIMGITDLKLGAAVICSALTAVFLLITVFTASKLVAANSNDAAADEVTDKDMMDWGVNRRAIFASGFVDQTHADEFFDALLTECARLKISGPTGFRMSGLIEGSAQKMASIPQSVRDMGELPNRAFINDAMMCFDGVLAGEPQAFFYNGTTVLRFNPSTFAVTPL